MLVIQYNMFVDPVTSLRNVHHTVETYYNLPKFWLLSTVVQHTVSSIDARLSWLAH